MSETVKVTLTCDKCKNSIDIKDLFISAGTYGVDIHIVCLNTMNAVELIKLLRLDEIKLMHYNDWQNAEKVISIIKGGKFI